MTELTQLFIDGLSFGLVIALIALGYTMVYGIIELINFAHGDLFMLGSSLAYGLWAGLILLIAKITKNEVNPTLLMVLSLVAWILIVPLACGCLNVLVDRIVYRPLRNAPKLAPFVSALGVSFIFMNIGLFALGSQSVDFPEFIPSDNLLPKDFPLRISGKDIMIFAVTIPLMLGLTYLVKFTRLGTAMRATAQNPTAAKLMGINTERVIALTFMIGGSLAGFGSIIFGLKYNTIHFQMGFQNGLYAFTAAVLGGIGNIPGAVVGSLVIGLLRSYGSAFIGEQWAQAIVFGMLIVILVFRPQGLLGTRVREKV
jgi:branched-chain amino acid transport system permease protein